MVLDIVWKKSPSNEFLNSARKRLMLKFYSTRLVPLCSTLCLTPDICFKDTVCFLIAYCLPLPERKALQCNNQQSAQAGCISVQAANSQIFHVSIVTKFHTSVQYFISMINEILVFSIVKRLLHSSLNPWYVRSKFCGNNTPCSETTYKKQNNQALMPGFLCHASSMFVIFGTEKLKWQLLYTLSCVYVGVCWGMCDDHFSARFVRREDLIQAILSASCGESAFPLLAPMVIFDLFQSLFTPPLFFSPVLWVIT